MMKTEYIGFMVTPRMKEAIDEAFRKNKDYKSGSDVIRAAVRKLLAEEEVSYV